ncbi:CotO family spore coat protein [Bacillus dakarensis]|uniref:CotO family spore coat protein n=1 Tax=Robertmurraya dakarensis TaxID=1926278 RepID=UPI000982145E|nr:CotO family spore coat protein [Bacillus dakarensis]
MRKTEKKREPLFYIQQPPFKAPNGKMQDTFSAKKAQAQKKQLMKENESENQKEKVDGKAQKVPLEELGAETSVFGKKPNVEELAKLSTDEVKETIQKSDIENSENDSQSRNQSHSSFNRVKPFKEMNVLEKIEYLHNFPKQLPPVPCQFQTTQEVFRGIIKEKSDHELVLALPNQGEAVIPIKDLIDIKMMGFNS